MTATIITSEDLQGFKIELLEDIKNIINSSSGQQTKKWLRSIEVRELLGISPGTLQNLRINGTIPYSKIGGVLYYDYNEILKILDENRIHNQF